MTPVKSELTLWTEIGLAFGFKYDGFFKLFIEKEKELQFGRQEGVNVRLYIWEEAIDGFKEQEKLVIPVLQ